MERLSAEGKFFHRSCFKCEYCGTTLRLSSYAFDVEDGKNGATPGGGGMAEEHCCFLFSHSSFLLPREVLLQAALLLPRVRLCPEEAARSPRSSRPRQGTLSVARSCCLSANAHPCSVRPPRRRTRPPRQERWPWTPPEGRRRCPPASSHPQVAHFRVWPWRLLPAAWPGARPLRCVASAVPFPGPATRWRSTP